MTAFKSLFLGSCGLVLAFNRPFCIAGPSDISTTASAGGDPTAPSSLDQDSSSDSSISKGWICLLVLSLILGSVLHRLPGSLLFGPTSAFWRASPLSAFIETGMIVAHLLSSAFDGLGTRLSDSVFYSWAEQYEYEERPPASSAGL